MESLLNYLAFENKNKMVDQLPWQQRITNCSNYNSVNSTLMGLIIQLEQFFFEKSLLLSVCRYLKLLFGKVI